MRAPHDRMSRSRISGTRPPGSPAAEQPVPRFGRVKPAHRLAGRRARRLMEADKITERTREIGAVRRRRGLIGDELGFGREGAIVERLGFATIELARVEGASNN